MYMSSRITENTNRNQNNAKNSDSWKPMRYKLSHIDNLSNKQFLNLINISYSIKWIIFATCLTQNTTIDIRFHTNILCNMWPPGEVLPNKEMSFVTRDHTYYHTFYKNSCKHQPTYNKFTVQPFLTWEYIFYFYTVCSVLAHATSSH